MGIKAKTAIALLALFISATGTVLAQQDVSFTTPDGQTVTLSSLRGRVVVLVFAGTQDPQCRDEFKVLGSLAERYQGKPVSIYWVSVDPAAVPGDKLKNPCGPTGSIAILRDPTRAAFKRYSGRSPQLPTMVVLDQQGQPQGPPRCGFNPDSDLINDLASVIDGLIARK